MRSRKWLNLAVFGAFIATLGYAKTPNNTNSLSPNFRLIRLNEAQEPFSSEVLKGKPVLLQFWASWCRSCSGISSELGQIIETYAQAPQSKAHFLSVSIDESLETAMNTVKARGSKKLADQSYLDSQNELQNKLKISSVPTILIVDRKGLVVMRKEGHLSAAEYLEIKQALQRLL